MSHSTALLILVLVAQAPSSPVRTGRALSDQDVAAISIAAGATPWYIHAPTTGFLAPQVYLKSDVTTSELRRGTLLIVAPGVDPSDSPAWRVLSRESWAQVPIAGRNPDRIDGADDPSRPFQVRGTFQAEALRDVVRCVRSCALPKVGVMVFDRNMLILSVSRADNTAEVQVTGDARSGVHVSVTLRQEAGTWVVNQVGFFVY